MRYLDDVTPPNIDCLYSDRHTIREWLGRADLVIGSVLIPGARAPHLVERNDLHLMKPGAVIIDVAIDQGGCIATSQPTSHAEPTFVVDNIVHYCVTNMPGAVGRTSTYALCNATLPYVLLLADQGLVAAAQGNHAVQTAVNIFEGELIEPAVAKSFNLPCGSNPFRS